MNWFGSGFIQIIIYGGGAQAIEEANALITEDGTLNILTELSQDILTES
jgi:hypothetical protein